MTTYSKFNIIYRLQRWLDSVPGQTFLNYTYNWGAAVVILGALFKLTHMPGANTIIWISMGVEVFVFFISGFDRPFIKTEEGRELPTHAPLPFEEDSSAADGEETVATAAGTPDYETDTLDYEPVTPYQPAAPSGTSAPGLQQQMTDSGNTPASPITTTSINLGVSPELSEEMSTATTTYVEKLNVLNEMLAKVAEQSQRLTRDSEEMENLNRTLTGIAKVYEMQLKSASQQIGTIDQINERSRMMATQIEQLNRIYARMIEAMTINMGQAATGGMGQNTPDTKPTFNP